jgi:hypothetical protein
MANGEERRRFVSPSGTRMSETVGSHWDLNDEFPWQEVHFHKGLSEYYLVVQGWALFISEHEKLLTTVQLEVGDTIKFDPLVAHVVLLGPGAIITTQLIGQAIGNPDKNGEDWWPVTDKDFRTWQASLVMAEESIRP